LCGVAAGLRARAETRHEDGRGMDVCLSLLEIMGAQNTGDGAVRALQAMATSSPYIRRGELLRTKGGAGRRTKTNDILG
jgi:hypothetical protein